MLTGLNPWTVAAHFLVSMVLVALATLLWLRSREPGVGQPLLRRPFVLLVDGIAAVTAVVLVRGHRRDRQRPAQRRPGRPAGPASTRSWSARCTPTSSSCCSG